MSDGKNLDIRPSREERMEGHTVLEPTFEVEIPTPMIFAAKESYIGIWGLEIDVVLAKNKRVLVGVAPANITAKTSNHG